MTIGLISDIHGNYEALQRVLSALDRLGVSEVYCLGDVVGYYAQVNECCEALRTREIPCLMGNHDWYMASGGFCARSQSVNDCLAYQRTVITADNMAWLQSFPVQRKVHGLHLVHGGWTDPIDEYLKPSAEYFARLSGQWFASGHTHIQAVHRFDGGKTYCNPGSVGQPRDNDPRAAFAVFDEGFSLHRIDYDVQRVCDLMQKAGFNDYYTGGLKTGAHKLRRP